MIRRAVIVLAAVGGAISCDAPPDDLLSREMIASDAIPDLLGPMPGDPDIGRKVFVSREAGHCVLCHVIDGLDAPFQGDVGPELTGIGTRLTSAQIRLRVADPSRVWPDTIMPSYYRVGGLNQVDPDFAGTPILTAQDIEHLVAYLGDQKGAAPE